MLALFVLVVLFAVGIIMARTDEYGGIGLTGALMSIISGVVLFVALMALIFHPMEVRGNIARFQSIEETARVARENGDEIEGAAFRMKIADANAWLAEQKYWNDTTFDIFIPDEVEDLEPIQ